MNTRLRILLVHGQRLNAGISFPTVATQVGWYSPAPINRCDTRSFTRTMQRGVPQRVRGREETLQRVRLPSGAVVRRIADKLRYVRQIGAHVAASVFKLSSPRITQLKLTSLSEAIRRRKSACSKYSVTNTGPAWKVSVKLAVDAATAPASSAACKRQHFRLRCLKAY